jgi:hypothetical protein
MTKQTLTRHEQTKRHQQILNNTSNTKSNEKSQEEQKAIEREKRKERKRQTLDYINDMFSVFSNT